MPIYEFDCQMCMTKTERLCKVGETGENLVCHYCNHVGLMKKFSAFSSLGIAGGKKSCAPGCGGNCSSCH